MKFVLYTNSISAHQLPIAYELAKRLGVDNFMYIYTGENLQKSGQEINPGEVNDCYVERLNESNKFVIENCEIMLCGGLRPIDLLEKRLSKGLKTYYQSERWFKPIPLKIAGFKCRLPGWIRMFVPNYRKMAKRFVKLANNNINFKILSIGPWAKMDFIKLGIHNDKIIDWGYYVYPSIYNNIELSTIHSNNTKTLHVLWVGRMLDWKRVDTIIKAVVLANEELEIKNKSPNRKLKNITLSVYGSGPEEIKLKQLSKDLQTKIKSKQIFDFHPPVPISEVRTLMRNHDLYVLSSNAQEGWGATLSEALSEGMDCLGTFEAGSSAALLPESKLFHAGDYKTLARLLLAFNNSNDSFSQLPKEYYPENAVSRLLNI